MLSSKPGQKVWTSAELRGMYAAGQLREAMDKRKLAIELVALVNDTTGAMIASAYNDQDTISGAIFGTGCNAAYMEDCTSMPKLPSYVPKDRKMAINCEYGAFDNGHRVLPRTKYDIQIDEESPRPGKQTFEKLSAGHYLGEIFRLAAVDLYERDLIFKGQPVEKLNTTYILDTGLLSGIENDTSPEQSDTKQSYKDLLGIEVTHEELILSRQLAEAIARRGAQLCTCGIAAMCRKTRTTKGHVAADGSVANKHPKFKARWADAMGEVLDWPKDRTEDPITITSAEDGSGMGAAVIAAMTIERSEEGDTVGVGSR